MTPQQRNHTGGAGRVPPHPERSETMPDLLCPTCHQPQRWKLTECRRCHAAIDCLCCDCDTAADPAEPDDDEPSRGGTAGAPRKSHYANDLQSLALDG
jgi:hypothetical protein